MWCMNRAAMAQTKTQHPCITVKKNKKTKLHILHSIYGMLKSNGFQLIQTKVHSPISWSDSMEK